MQKQKNLKKTKTRNTIKHTKSSIEKLSKKSTLHPVSCKDAATFISGNAFKTMTNRCRGWAPSFLKPPDDTALYQEAALVFFALPLPF